MKRAHWFALAAGVLSVAVTAAASAHHSFAAVYDMQKPITVKGTIVNVRLANPHSWFYLDVKNEAGEVERWAFEDGTPSGMIRNGYKPNIVPPGSDAAVVRVPPTSITSFTPIGTPCSGPVFAGSASASASASSARTVMNEL